MRRELPVKFHIFDLEFQPYKEQSGKIGSFNILKSCIRDIDAERNNNSRFIIIDRHENRDKAESRKLFISTAAYSGPDRMYKCKIHLIRDKSPSFLDREKMSFESVNILKNKEIVETTSFYIDMDKKSIPTIICEFSNLGPKISDIEYYFRYISSRKKLFLSKACKAKVHMEKSVEQVMDSLHNVFRFRFRARPENLPSLYRNTDDAFFSNMQALGNLVDPKSIRVDLSFKDQLGKNVISEKNYKMIGVTKKILHAVANDTKVLEDIDDFYVEYEDENGDNNDFNLVRGKVALKFTCPFKDGKKGQLDRKEMFNLAIQEYKKYKEDKMIPSNV